jgi:hypothetical protein
MSRASGLVLILGGLAVAAYAIAPDDPGEGEASGPYTVVIKSPAAQEQQEQMVASERTIVAPQPRPATRLAQSGATERAPAASTPFVATVTPRAGEPPAPRIAIPKGEALTRELQKELRRVGCYDGEINGAWTQSTRRAMKAFTDRLNASLPVDAPDPVLYALLQGERGEVCGKPCPAGQALSEEGRCLPAAIVAKAGKPSLPPAGAASPARATPTPAIVGWSTTTTAAAPAPAPAVPLGAPPTEGRMALAGPPAETPPDAAPPVPQRAAPKPPASYSGRREPNWARRTLARQLVDSQF